MTTPQQSAVGRQEKIRGLNKQLVKEASSFMISSNLSAVGLFFFALSLSEKYNHLFSPETQIGSGVIFFGGLAVGLIELARMVKITQSTAEETARWSEMGGVSAIIAPLSERPSPKERKQLTAYQAPMVKLLPSGQPDSDLVDLEVAQSDELLTLAGPRIEALEFILRSLLDPRVKSVSLRGPEERREILEQLKYVLAAPPRSSGLSLTGPEEYILAIMTNIGAMTERAPETMVAYLELLGALIESYVLNNRLPPAGEAMADDLMTQAIRAGFFIGVEVSPPVEEWKKAQDLKNEEAAKVVLTEHQVIGFAKSAVALGNNRAPEVRKAFVKIVPGLKDLLEKERQRLERIRQNGAELNIERAVINTVLAILDISIEGLVDKGTIDMLNQLFSNRLSGKTRIAPRNMMDEFKNTGLGSWSIEGNRIIVVARDINLADVLACAVVLCYPHIPRIEICIKKNIQEDKIVDQSVMIPTGVFYSQRLILGEKQFISGELRKQSAPVETMFSPEPVLLEAVVTA